MQVFLFVTVAVKTHIRWLIHDRSSVYKSFLKRMHESSKGHGNALLSYGREEVRVQVSLAPAREHGDNHLPLVLFSRRDLKMHFGSKVTQHHRKNDSNRTQTK